MKPYVAVLFSAIFLSGCASLSPEECRTADWYLIGLNDAENGRPTGHLEEHRKACAKVAVVPDHFLYGRGHEKGRKTYCTTANGFAQGSQGATYHGICEGFAAQDFLRGYDDGRAIYLARERLERAEREIDQQQNTLHRLRESISASEHRLSHTSDADARRKTQSEINQWWRDLGHAESSLSQAHHEQRRAEDELRYLERKMRDFGYW